MNANGFAASLVVVATMVTVSPAARAELVEHRALQMQRHQMHTRRAHAGTDESTQRESLDAQTRAQPS